VAPLHSCGAHGFVLKQAHVTVAPLQGRSIMTQAGLSGGRQHPFFGEVPGGQ
jgi:hypothetical protein